jgi:hypothetical protein
MKPLNPFSTGIYIAYPTSPILRPIYRGYKTLVNDQHTKVGIARRSFAEREKNYFVSFNKEVVFRPILELPREQLRNIERALIAELRNHHARVGRAREWFDTTDRDSLAQLIINIVDQL